MKNKVKKISLILTIIFGLLFFILYGLKSILPNISLNYEFWTRWDEIIIILTLFVISVLVYVTTSMKGKASKTMTLLLGISLMFVLLIINIFGFHGMRSLENDHHKVYLIGTGFGESGISTVYLKENFLYSRKISSTATETAIYEVDYQLEGDILHIIIYDGEQATTNTIDLDLTTYD